MKFQHIPSLTLSTLTDHPQFLWLRNVFKQYFDDWLVSFVMFRSFLLKHKNCYHSKDLNVLKLQPIQLL